MTKHNQPFDSRYDSLSSPLKSIRVFVESSQDALLREESEILGGTIFKRIGKSEYRRGSQLLKAGDLELIAGRSTPVQSTNISEKFKCFLTLPFIGGYTKVTKGQCHEIVAGDLHLDLNNFGTKTRTYSSSLFIAIDERRLEAMIRRMGGDEATQGIGESIIIKGSAGNSRHGTTGKLWSLVNLIDQLHGEDPYLPCALGLSEQFYRILTVVLLEGTDRIADAKKRWSRQANNWTNGVDDLVDYIRTNANPGITLTDLEEKSHYSARHLQNLFREKFNCTPMQFVRRQRLSRAMEKLQTADWDDSVISIGRDCGYRFTSNFSSDFKREFGVAPSVVLRASRSTGHKV